jgi:hypothetical protein
MSATIEIVEYREPEYAAEYVTQRREVEIKDELVRVLVSDETAIELSRQGESSSISAALLCFVGSEVHSEAVVSQVNVTYQPVNLNISGRTRAVLKVVPSREN